MIPNGTAILHSLPPTLSTISELSSRTRSVCRIDTPRIRRERQEEEEKVEKRGGGSVDIHGRWSGEIRRAGRFTVGRRAVDQAVSSGMRELNFYFRRVYMRRSATRRDTALRHRRPGMQDYARVFLTGAIIKNGSTRCVKSEIFRDSRRDVFAHRGILITIAN